jgi:heptosyltransferase III
MSPRLDTMLVICTRRIGDVLLATSAVRALKLAHPQAAIDMLVFDGTQGVITANQDLRSVLVVAERPTLGQHLRLIRRIWRRYDLAVSLLPGDRPTLYAWAAGRTRVGTLAVDDKSRWKRTLLNEWVGFDNLSTHTVAMNLRVVEQIGVAQRAAPVVSWSAEDEKEVGTVFASLKSGETFAVLHMSPKYAYKTWSAAGWRDLAHWLQERGIVVLVAGGGASEELRYIDSLLVGFPENTINLAGKMGLGALAFLLSRAVLYVGTDTAVTHMAAALGVPTVALFGPSNPVKWGPWPRVFDSGPSPWEMHGSARVANVYLVQGQKHCVPCLLEGCDRHIGSLSECLQQLPASRVISAAELLLDAAVSHDGEACAS